MSRLNANMQSLTERGLGRREMFMHSAALLGAGALSNSSLSAQIASPDVAVLNYALTLENLESAFYTGGLSQLSSADFANSAFIQDFGSMIGGSVYAYLSSIRDQEAQHVQTLQSLITSLHGTPVKPCTYNFNFKTADEFIALAASIENTGVMAYDGAIFQILS